MFVELNNVLEADADHPPHSQFIVVRENAADGTFVLHHHVALYLRSRNNVCFVGLAQAFNHYTNVGTKLGVNLKTAKECGNLVFVEGLNRGGHYITNEARGNGTTLGDSGAASAQSSWSWLGLGGETLESLFQTVRISIEQLPDWKSKPLLVVIDDLYILQALGVPYENIVWFVHYLHQFLIRSTGGAYCLLALLHLDADGEDKEGELLVKHLYHQSDVIIETHGLTSGYSKDVHGEMTVTWRDGGQAKPLMSRSKVLQYKITDKNVNLFAIGTSTAVL